jgi:hypothetical protein
MNVSSVSSERGVPTATDSGGEGRVVEAELVDVEGVAEVDACFRDFVRGNDFEAVGLFF